MLFAVGTPTTPEAMRQQIAAEIANWKQIVEANNIKVDQLRPCRRAGRPRSLAVKNQTGVGGPFRAAPHKGEKCNDQAP